MQEPCYRHLLPRRDRLRRGTARMRGLAINSIRRGQGLYNRCNAVLERVLGNKGWAVMTVPELDATLAWLEHDRLADHLRCLWMMHATPGRRAGDRPGATRRPWRARASKVLGYIGGRVLHQRQPLLAPGAHS